MQSPANLMAFGVSVGIVALSTVLLVTGRDILIPLAISIVIWYLLDALVRLFGRVRIASWHLPGWVGLPAALITIVVFLVAIGTMIGDNIFQVIEAAPGYQANLERLIAEDAAKLLTTLKGPQYDLANTGIVSVIPGEPVTEPLLDPTSEITALVLSLPFDLLYLEASA